MTTRCINLNLRFVLRTALMEDVLQLIARIVVQIRRFLTSMLFLVTVGGPASAQTENCMTFRSLENLSVVEQVLKVRFYGERFDIFATGTICSGTADVFEAYVRDNKIDAAMVHFDSPGGSLAEGLRLGELIRVAGFDTEITSLEQAYRRLGRKEPNAVPEAVCASACAYAFVGGRYRFFENSKAQRLGVHQFAASGDSLSAADAQLVGGMLVAYLRRMDADPIGFTVASQARSDEMFWFTPSEARSLNWANNGRAKPTAEVKVLDARPYLRLDQVTASGTTRVLLVCEGQEVHILAGVFADFSGMVQLTGREKTAYLETDERVYLDGPMDTTTFTFAQGGFFLDRVGSKSLLREMLKADSISVKFEVGGDFWHGNDLDLVGIREAAQSFLNGC